MGRFDTLWANKRQVIRWLRIVYAAICHLNREGARIHPTRLAVDVQPPKSPFQREGTTDAVRAEHWRSALFHWISERLDRDATPASEHLGAIALSAAMCGGLLDARNIMSLVARAVEPIAVAGRLAYFDFESIHRGVKVEMLQRWHPDALTEALIARLPAGTPCTVREKELLAAVKSIIARGAAGDPPRRLAALVRCAASFWLLRASRVDVEVARGNRLTQSLKHPAWLRLHRALPFTQAASDPEAGTPPPASRPRSDDNDDPLADETGELPDDTRVVLPWLDDLLALGKLRDDLGPSALQSRAEAWALPPDAQWAKPYRSWLVAMLRGPNASGDLMKPATACAYFQAVVPALIAQLGTESPAAMAREDIEAWYGDLLEPLPPGRQRITMASGLREFHAHLVADYQAEPISAGDILGPEAELQTVDARIVCPDEVSAARRWLEDQGHRGEHPLRMRAISLLLMLVFRCGLRRMEAIKLRLCDLHPADGGDLRVLPHAGRRLKSHSSRRSIPLRALLSDAEYCELMAWLTARRKEEGASGTVDENQYLFSVPRLAPKPKGAPGMDEAHAEPRQHGLTPESAADWMHAALRAATGDEAVHLHHLRHSFASWTYLRLRIGCFPGLVEHFSEWPETCQWLKDSRRLVRALIPGGNPGARSAAYAVARLLGHSGPEISFEHYIHMSDVIWFGLTQRETASIPRPALIKATGCKRSTAYRKATPADLVTAMRSTFKSRYRHHAPIAASGAAPRVPPPPGRGGKYGYSARLDRVFAILHARDCGESTETIARSLGAQPEQVDSTIALATVLGARMRWPAKEFREAVRLCPPLWKGNAEKEFGQSLVEALARLDSTNPRLLAAGVETHLGHFNPEKRDVVFRSTDEAPEAKEYLRFIDALGTEAGRVQVVLRDLDETLARSGDWQSLPEFAGWRAVLPLSEQHEVIATNSPNPKRTAYRKWIGIRLVPRDGRANHYLVAGVFLLSAIVARSGAQAEK